MFNKFLHLFTFLIIGMSALSCPGEQVQPIPMPLYDVGSQVESYRTPQPIRDESVRKYLACSFRIKNGGGYGSGTLCYYDGDNNVAYVITCSHLFRRGDKECTVEAFYKNSEKLTAPVQYKAIVLCFRENYDAYPGEDIAFVKFTPDWHPDNYFPIAKVDFTLPKESIVSAGCDNATETAAYMVKIVGKDGNFIITEENSPRPGRSGGGLLTSDGYYIGICVRTSDVSGNGRGYFVPLDAIHKYAQEQKLAYLLIVPKPNDLLRKMKIIDRNNPQGNYPQDYVPIP